LVNKFEDDDKFEINKTPWYKGKTLLQALEQLKQPIRLINKPLRISLFKVISIVGIGPVLIGIIKSGILKKNMPIFITAPYNEFNCVKTKSISIVKFNESLDVAIPGDIVGIKIKSDNEKFRYIGVFILNDYKKGKINSPIIGNYEKNFSINVEKFTAIIDIMNINKPIKIGFCPVIYCHTTLVRVKIIEIIKKIDRRTNKIISKNLYELKNGERAFVVLNVLKKFVCEKYIDNPYLGAFVMRDNNRMIAVGKIIEIIRTE